MASENPHQPEIDRAIADKALAEANKATSEAQKAQSEAKTAADKAKIGDINFGSGQATGNADVSATSAGGAEATLLAARSVNVLAAKFAQDLSAKLAGKTVLLFTASTLPDFQALSLFRAQMRVLKGAFDSASQSAAPASLLPNERARLEGVTALGVGLDAVSKLLSFAKTDYKFVAMTVTGTDSMLAAALAEHLAAAHASVQMPGLFQAEIGGANSPVQQEVETVLGIGTRARGNQQVFERRQAEIEKAAGDKPDDNQKAEVAKMKQAAATWKSVADSSDAWVKQVSTSDDKGNSILSGVLRQGVIKQKLDSGAFLLLVTLHATAGGGYTEKNLWSSLGASPFHVMAGAVGSYQLIDGPSGNVLASAFRPHHGGYLSVDKISAHVNN